MLQMMSAIVIELVSIIRLLGRLYFKKFPIGEGNFMSQASSTVVSCIEFFLSKTLFGSRVKKRFIQGNKGSLCQNHYPLVVGCIKVVPIKKIQGRLAQRDFK